MMTKNSDNDTSSIASKIFKNDRCWKQWQHGWKYWLWT